MRLAGVRLPGHSARETAGAVQRPCRRDDQTLVLGFVTADTGEPVFPKREKFGDHSTKATLLFGIISTRGATKVHLPLIEHTIQIFQLIQLSTRLTQTYFAHGSALVCIS